MGTMEILHAMYSLEKGRGKLLARIEVYNLNRHNNTTVELRGSSYLKGWWRGEVNLAV